MARKAPLLGLINQGKCLAVTHRAVLSRGSSLIAALSFMGGVPLSTLTSPSCQRSPHPQVASVWWWAFGGSIAEWEPTLASLQTERDDEDNADADEDRGLWFVSLSWAAV